MVGQLQAHNSIYTTRSHAHPGPGAYVALPLHCAAELSDDDDAGRNVPAAATHGSPGRARPRYAPLSQSALRDAMQIATTVEEINAVVDASLGVPPGANLGGGGGAAAAAAAPTA